MKLTVMKEVGAKWLISMYGNIWSRPEICKNGFVKAGIGEAISIPDNVAPVVHNGGDDEADPFTALD